IRRLDGLLQGDYRTLFRGFGVDLADLREYQYGDDVRHIDWNITARLQTPYVRQFNEDREVTAWFLLDMSPSVDFGSSGVSKRTLLEEFVSVLSGLLTRHGNRVGAIIFDGESREVVPARSGRRHTLHLLDRVLSTPSPDHAPETDLTALLEAGESVIRRRSLLFLISDFISRPGWSEALGRLSRRHELLGVRLYDPMELELPDLGMVYVQDAETGEQLLLDTSDSRFRRRFEEEAARREAEVRGNLSEAGVDTLELSTEADLVAAVARFAELRKARGVAGAPEGGKSRVVPMA
ncbi:MAG: DUF58 domain-containing protein, partial [Alkalispirochaetaceae bacterium]